MDVKFLIAGDRAVSVEFGSVISLEVNARVKAWWKQFRPIVH